VTSGCGVGDDFDLTCYRRAMGANLDGVVFGVHAALPALRARGGGAIVATASLAGLTGTPHDPLYCANKHAVVGLARSLGPALAEEGIRFNAVCPGYAESAIIEPFRDVIAATGVAIIPAEKVAGAVVELFAGDAAGECVVIQPGREPLPFAFRGVPGPR
jgi:NAD(P)-dependent dehydrogenase (short-subunit alcohol dehydrogenase family)